MHCLSTFKYFIPTRHNVRTTKCQILSHLWSHGAGCQTASLKRPKRLCLASPGKGATNSEQHVPRVSPPGAVGAAGSAACSCPHQLRLWLTFCSVPLLILGPELKEKPHSPGAEMGNGREGESAPKGPSALCPDPASGSGRETLAARPRAGAPPSPGKGQPRRAVPAPTALPVSPAQTSTFSNCCNNGDAGNGI